MYCPGCSNGFKYRPDYYNQYSGYNYRIRFADRLYRNFKYKRYT